MSIHSIARRRTEKVDTTGLGALAEFESELEEAPAAPVPASAGIPPPAAAAPARPAALPAPAAWARPAAIPAAPPRAGVPQPSQSVGRPLVIGALGGVTLCVAFGMLFGVTIGPFTLPGAIHVPAPPPTLVTSSLPLTVDFPESPAAAAILPPEPTPAPTRAAASLPAPPRILTTPEPMAAISVAAQPASADSLVAAIAALSVADDTANAPPAPADGDATQPLVRGADSPATPPASDAPAPPSDDRGRIRALLDAYTAAYERFDTAAAAALWPGVDTRALGRAFGSLSRQRVTFERCTTTIAGLEATSWCTGVIEYVRRVGDTTPQSRSTSWTFSFDRRTGDWRISNVSAR